MIRVIRDKYGLNNNLVLSVLEKIPREKFVPREHRAAAYEDKPLDIGFGQTISQPYTVALMTHLLLAVRPGVAPRKGEKVLEIGTGSGYQAAILSKLFGKVYTIEIIPELARRAKKTLRELGFRNVFVKIGSGEWGWEEQAPFDAVVITAGIEDEIPERLLEQLKSGGVLVAPVGKGYDKVMTRYVKLKTPAYWHEGKTQGSKVKVSEEEVTKIVRLGGSCYQIQEFGTFHFVPFVKGSDTLD